MTEPIQKPLQGPASGWLIRMEDLTQAEPKAALAYWQSKLRGRTMPSPADIDPTEIPRILTNISMIDVIAGPPADFFFKIEGETVSNVFATRRMGKRLTALEDALGAAYPMVWELYNYFVAGKRPLFTSSRLESIGRSFYQVEATYLPLSRDDKDVHRIFFCMGVIARPEDSRP